MIRLELYVNENNLIKKFSKITRIKFLFKKRRLYCLQNNLNFLGAYEILVNFSGFI